MPGGHAQPVSMKRRGDLGWAIEDHERLDVLNSQRRDARERGIEVDEVVAQAVELKRDEG